MSKPALLNVALIAANIGAAELEFAVKKVHVLDVIKKGPTDEELDAAAEKVNDANLSLNNLTLDVR